MNKSFRTAAVVLGVAVGAVGAAVAASSPASAAPVTVTGCAGTTAPVSVTFDDAALAGGAMVPIHDNTGGVTYPAPTDKAMSSPVCGLQRGADGTLRREWLYCTAPELNTCATAPLVRKGSAATGVGQLTDLDKAHLAYILDKLVDNGTVATRITSQRFVWCVTEHVPAGQPAPRYDLSANEKAFPCPDWPSIDPGLNAAPTLALVGPSGQVAVGAAARFSLSTDASPIALTADGLAGMAPCPGAAGVTVTGGLLTIAHPDKAVPVALCATRTSAGTGSLHAVIAQRLGRTLEFWQRDAKTQFCQGMLSSETLSNTAAAAVAQAVFVADVTTTTAATTTTVAAGGNTTTTVSIDGNVSTTVPNVLDTIVGPPVTLPATGARSHDDSAFWALVLLLAGVALVALGRRPTTR